MISAHDSSRKVLCLVNPRSGGNRGAQVAKSLAESPLPPAVLGLEVLLLDGSELPSPEMLQQKYTDVLIAGGDGTFSSLLPRFLGSALDFHLLALGTGNDLARELGVRNLWRGNASEFLQHSLALPRSELQVWRIDFMNPGQSSFRRLFLNYVSLGWDGVVVEEFDRLRAKGAVLAGKAGPWGNRILYAYSGLRHPFYWLPAVNVSAGELSKEFPAGLRALIFANIRSVMGLGKTNALSNYSDDLLELLPVRSPLDYPQMLLPFSCRFPRMKSELLQSKEFTVQLPEGRHPIPVQIDGEFVAVPAFESIVISSQGLVHVRGGAS